MTPPDEFLPHHSNCPCPECVAYRIRRHATLLQSARFLGLLIVSILLWLAIILLFSL